MRLHLLSLLVMLCLSFEASAQQQAANPQTQTSAVTEEELITGPSPKDGFIRAFDTYHACKRYFRKTFVTRENIARKSTCLGYFYGVGSILLHLQMSQVRTGACLPEDFSVEDMMLTFVQWAEVNPENLKNVSATSAIMRALGTGYPCY